MSEFKTTPMLNSWELRIKLLEEVIDIKDAEIAALRARCEAAEAKIIQLNQIITTLQDNAND